MQYKLVAAVHATGGKDNTLIMCSTIRVINSLIGLTCNRVENDTGDIYILERVVVCRYTVLVNMN